MQTFVENTLFTGWILMTRIQRIYMVVINDLMIHVCFIVKPSAALGRFTIVTRSGEKWSKETFN